MMRADVLIIGSGIAGLSVAIKVAERFPRRRVLVITKQESAESNTRYAQGGIAVVSDFERDSFEGHVSDTLEAGDGLCDADVVNHVVRQAPARLQELIDMGADFDREPTGELMLGREGGHKASRIIHSQDVTGLNISTALLEKVKTLPNVAVLSHHIAVDLIAEEVASAKGKVARGAYVLDLKENTIEKYQSLVTVVATGGIGQLYSTTTNPLIATGDGIAMAWRAGAQVANMEFIQFHPTALYDRGASPAFLISEAVRGQGAYLRNASGKRFMFQYHRDGELACRDVVSRAIASEIQASGHPCVYLDCTHIPEKELLSHFPNIYRKCLSKGIDITVDYIPVAPAAHYLCGGINVDRAGQTSVKNLYACGECSNTGLHGANRLASNSLLEAIVYAHACFEDIEKTIGCLALPALSEEPERSFATMQVDSARIAEIKSQLQTLMTHNAGIVRTTRDMEHARNELAKLGNELGAGPNVFVPSAAWYELRNMITCAQLVIKQSLERKENKGGFFNRSLEVRELV
ncbi:MAG TPA: L-aspartate oxidase [Chryseosolibacter sp.]